MTGYLSDRLAKETPVCFLKQTGVFYLDKGEFVFLHKAHDYFWETVNSE